MKITIYKEIEDIRELWEELYSRNVFLSWYQCYKWNKKLQDAFYKKKIVNIQYVLHYFVCDNKFIAPVVVNRKGKNIEFLGANEGSDYLSFIFDRAESSSKIVEYLDAFFKYYHNYCIILDRLNENNIITTILSEYGKDIFTREEKECVYIPLNRENDTFIETLSKSSRQNYRTAINRLKKDSLDYLIEIKNSILTEKDVNKLLEIYKARRSDCEENTGLLYMIKSLIKKCFYQDYDVLSEYAKTEAVFLATIKINDVYAAFCEGYYNNDKTLSIARVSTNPKYYQYSPGYILLVNVLEQLKNEIMYFDLTRGIEDYKFKLGGVVHKNIMFTVNARANKPHIQQSVKE